MQVGTGKDQKQRPRSHKVEEFPKDEYREDNMYHHAEVARVVTEMVRPYVSSKGGQPWGGFASSHLRVAGLARIIQTKLYLHRCSTRYCLKNRTTCRFFFPWPKMPHQQFDSNMDRVACQRRCEEDDQDAVLVCGYSLKPCSLVIKTRAPVVKSTQPVPHDVLACDYPRAALRSTSWQR